MKFLPICLLLAVSACAPDYGHLSKSEALSLFEAKCPQPKTTAAYGECFRVNNDLALVAFNEGPGNLGIDDLMNAWDQGDYGRYVDAALRRSGAKPNW